MDVHFFNIPLRTMPLVGCSGYQESLPTPQIPPHYASLQSHLLGSLALCALQKMVQALTLKNVLKTPAVYKHFIYKSFCQMIHFIYQSIILYWICLKQSIKTVILYVNLAIKKLNCLQYFKCLHLTQ